MKTEIVHKYKAQDDFYIQEVLVLDGQTVAVLNTKYRTPAFISLLVNGIVVHQINLANFPTFSPYSTEQSFFKYRSGFGLMDFTDTILLWEDIYDSPVLVTISNPFPSDLAGRRHTTNFGEYSASDDCLYFGIEHISNSGFPARYWAKLKLDRQADGELVAKWSHLNELPIKDYPETKLRQRLEEERSWDAYLMKRSSDWLNINAFTVKDELIYIATDGGSLTRAKSGIRYEYSFISLLNGKGELIKNYEIEEGIGCFTYDKTKYLLQSRAKRNKIFIYGTSNFEIEDELTLSSKQNLGEEKNVGFKTNIVGQSFYLNNAMFLHICKIV